MIEMPKRSVTRFFIPMIDVLTLLFSIYLLMPLAARSPADAERDRLAQEEKLRRLEAELARRATSGEDVPGQLREELEKLRAEKVELLKNRLAVRVLEIDPADGLLYYRDPDRVQIRNRDDALKLIDRDRRVQVAATKELYYLILYPRASTSGYPTREQRRSYDRWFEGVAMSYDIPGKDK